MREVSIGKKITAVSRQIIMLKNKCLEDFECKVSAAHVHAFMYFAQNSGCTEKQAAKAIGKDKTSIAKSVKRLTQQGLIESRADESDGRYKHILPTQKGEIEMQKVCRALLKVSVVMSRGLGKQQIEAFLETLERMQNNAKNHLESR